MKNSLITWIMLSVIVLVFGGFYIKKQIENDKKIETKLETNTDITTYEINYNYILLYIMYSEDMLTKPSNKLTGQSLIGFGHAVKKGESFDNLTYREAFDLLQVDYCKCIDLAIDAGYCKLDNKQLAVALMFYNMKPESVNKILSNMNNIDRYIYYTKDGKSRISKNLINNRAFEKELYFNEGIINPYKFF